MFASDQNEVSGGDYVTVHFIRQRAQAIAQWSNRARDKSIERTGLHPVSDPDVEPGLRREVARRSSLAIVADRPRVEPASLRQGAARRGGEEWTHSLGRSGNRSGGRLRAGRAPLQSG